MYILNVFSSSLGSDSKTLTNSSLVNPIETAKSYAYSIPSIAFSKSSFITFLSFSFASFDI